MVTLVRRMTVIDGLHSISIKNYPKELQNSGLKALIPAGVHVSAGLAVMVEQTFITVISVPIAHDC